MTTSAGEWMLLVLPNTYLVPFLLQVLGMPPPNPNLRKDELIWGLAAKGHFTLKSAYQMVVEIDEDGGHTGWKKIGQWPWPHRIRHFLTGWKKI
ncbi:unnamed protein product [Linum trigynum]|uniref:Uncharacterized protein n=1 Tax=Linum trigynum TaxID=586398 RepID=A0AAV2FB00_9ROSI